MIFKLGKTPEKLNEEWEQKYNKWDRYFTVYPKQIGVTTEGKYKYAWLCYIERRGWLGTIYKSKFWDYREIKK